MGVPAEVIQYLFGTAKRRFGIDDPLTVAEGLQIVGEVLGIRQQLEFAVELQLLCRVGVFEITKVELAEAPREHLHRQEEVWTAGHPTAAVHRDSATGHDTVQVRMKIEGLPPRVQDAEKADLRAQVF